MNLITGASPKTTGIYYDASYSRTLYPPGTTTRTADGLFPASPGVPDQPPGTPVNLTEEIDIDSKSLSGGGSPGFDATSANLFELPLLFIPDAVDPSIGTLAPI